ncbi:ribosome biogenesis GTP-binding protein YihA/YsxC [Acidisoma silvae]|uniref:Probable GTP-binding protein EngB n=1 Tax=Acidisoma silvae TaxID=2802396 RepID=A0A964DXF8_9PROT|nr:ribosome biogenesis GTP-binding protein YihA/YsxC [Acidisoma silvae]MCB8874007.1 YihA family ribosome biogenesis GTP-binding protein [Acidisoma silvae]
MADKVLGGGDEVEGLNLALGPADADELEAARVYFAAPCNFFYASQSLDQLPEPRGIELAFAGRSNVGKSSLVNAITGQNTLARASNTPGRTRQLNFFDLSGRLILVDMPGYGYAQAEKKVKEDWQGLMFNYLRGRPNLARVALLMDGRIEVKESDLAVMDLLDKAAVTFQIVMTKADGLKPGALARKTEELTALARKHAAGFPQILVTSARTGLGIPEARAAFAALAPIISQG